MNQLRLLLVEDDPDVVTQYREVLEDYVERQGRTIEMLVEGSVKDAKCHLDASFDVAVIDLNLGKDTRDGGNVVAAIEKHFRIPVAILTGTPDDATLEPPVVKVFTKGEHGFEDVLDFLWGIFETGITRIMGGRGEMEERLSNVFLRSLLPTLNVWIQYAAEDAARTEKALLRFALGHLVADLEGDETPCYPEEFYLAPPLDPLMKKTGSLVECKGNGAHYVIMTPACDLVLRNGGMKARSIVLAEVVPEQTLFSELSANSRRQKDLRKNNDSGCFHALPKTGDFQPGFIDFSRLQTVPIDAFDHKFQLLEARIAPSFIKDIVSRFSSFYARQGQPAILLPSS